MYLPHTSVFDNRAHNDGKHALKAELRKAKDRIKTLIKTFTFVVILGVLIICGIAAIVARTMTHQRNSENKDDALSLENQNSQVQLINLETNSTVEFGKILNQLNTLTDTQRNLTLQLHLLDSILKSTQINTSQQLAALEKDLNMTQVNTSQQLATLEKDLDITQVNTSQQLATLEQAQATLMEGQAATNRSLDTLKETQTNAGQHIETLTQDLNMTQVNTSQQLATLEQGQATLMEGQAATNRSIDAVKETQTDAGQQIETLTENLATTNHSLEAVMEKVIDADRYKVTGSWEMIFRATAGNGYSVFDAWSTGANTTDIKPTIMVPGSSRHYRNTPNITDWTNVELVKYSLFEHGREVAFVIFNGVGSTNLDWFDKDRVVDSSWSKVASKTETYNYFSLPGHASLGRRFFMNLNYGSCSADKGFTVVSDVGPRSNCGFETDTHNPYPQFLYSIIDGPALWGKPMYGKADYIAVFCRYTE